MPSTGISTDIEIAKREDDVRARLHLNPYLSNPRFHALHVLEQKFGEGRSRHRQAAAPQLAQHEVGGRKIAHIDRSSGQTHPQIAGRRTNLDLERNHVAAMNQRPQHFERVGFHQRVEAQVAPRGDFVEDLPAAQRSVRQRRSSNSGLRARADLYHRGLRPQPNRFFAVALPSRRACFSEKSAKARRIPGPNWPRRPPTTRWTASYVFPRRRFGESFPWRAKTSGDSSRGVSNDIFRRIQDSFTTQDLLPKAPRQLRPPPQIRRPGGATRTGHRR
jgi:hypothetical protein